MNIRSTEPKTVRSRMVKGPATASYLVGAPETDFAAVVVPASFAFPAAVSGPVGCESCGPGLSWFICFSFVRRRLGQSGPVFSAGFRGKPDTPDDASQDLFSLCHPTDTLLAEIGYAAPSTGNSKVPYSQALPTVVM